MLRFENGLKRFLVAGLFALLAGRLGAAAMPGADGKWLYLQSPHFELYSRNSERESRLLLHNLELMHAIFFEAFGFTPVRAMPVTVYFFSREKHFEAYKPADTKKVENIATYYHPEPDRGILTVAPLPTYEAAQQLAFASYSHHLLRLLDEPAPLWYGYGVSGIFRNLEIGSASFELGRPDAHQIGRLQSVQLIPPDVMLGADHKSDAYRSNQQSGLFHDESWAMVHYLYFGKHAIPRERISEFVAYALSNSRTFDAAATQRGFEATLGMTYGQFKLELTNYLRTGRYGWKRLDLPAVAPAKSYSVRGVPPDEIGLRLAELALRVNRSPLGKLALLEALEHAPDPTRLEEALASDALRNGDRAGAAERWERSVAAGSTNPAVLHELCQFEGRQHFQQFDLYFRLPDDVADRMRSRLKQLIAASPRLPASYEMLAWVEASAREPQIPNVNLVQKNFPRVKAKPRTMLALAVAHLRLNDKAGAAGMLDEIERLGPDDWSRYGAEITRAKLEDRPVNRDNLPGSPTKAGSRARPVPIQVGKPQS
jgi:hypothetical protein